MTLAEILALQEQNRKGTHICYMCGEEWEEKDMQLSVNDGWVCDDCAAEYEAEFANNFDLIQEFVQLEGLQQDYWVKYIFEKVLKRRMSFMGYFSLQQKIKTAVQRTIAKEYYEVTKPKERYHDEAMYCFKDEYMEHPQDDYLDWLYDKIWR